VNGFRGLDGRLASVGIQCPFCYSTVDDSFAPGIGRRLDGWPNRDLNVGAIVALAPDLTAVADLLQTDQATVEHYNEACALNLTEQQKVSLTE
jgi:hypothetical protein